MLAVNKHYLWVDIMVALVSISHANFFFVQKQMLIRNKIGFSLTIPLPDLTEQAGIGRTANMLSHLIHYFNVWRFPYSENCHTF